MSYSDYVSAARIAHDWGLTHDKHENGITIHHLPKNTTRATVVLSSIRRAVKSKVNVRWIDEWTAKVSW